MVKNKEQAGPYDAVVVGAGFAGLYMLHRLRAAGVSARAFEAGDGVGGTWYWNRYPGARVDVESLEYSYSFSPELEAEWEWTERYAAQPEMLGYLNHVADRFDLRRDIQLGTRVTAAHYDEAAEPLERDAPTTATACRARYCVMATGCLSTAQGRRDFPGPRASRAPSYHTGRWPHEGVDFTGKRVAVIGTGSSAIQSIPQIAAAGRPRHRLPAHAELQRAGPQRAARPGRGRATGPANRAELRAQERARAGFGIAAREHDKPALEAAPDGRASALRGAVALGGFALLGAFNDLIGRPAAPTTPRPSSCATRSARSSRTRAVAEKLSPKDYPIGAKRICVDTGYYETFNRDNVSLVDLPEDADRGDHADGRDDRGRASTRSTPSSSRPASTP